MKPATCAWVMPNSTSPAPRPRKMPPGRSNRAGGSHGDGAVRPVPVELRDGSVGDPRGRRDPRAQRRVHLRATPIISAAASALPAEQTGAGLGILHDAQFLGAGTGPALFGVLVTAWQHSGGGAVNPLFAGPAGAAFSDAFLAMAVVAVLALIVAFRMRPTASVGGGQSSPSRSAQSSSVSSE
ncbi:hypothetical protein [Amycolatopsis thermalba]|uniref:hypothetical protein n=1 Tax=Amycolatopsis thermalba TaxID=944492 RepID=UPI000E227BF1|nr:hypothetical protein [Amycolatopsis thermalba]